MDLTKVYDSSCLLVIHKYKGKDPNEDVMKAFHYFDEDDIGKISIHNFCLSLSTKSSLISNDTLCNSTFLQYSKNLLIYLL